MEGNVFSNLVSITNGLHRDDRSERDFQILHSDLKQQPKATNALFKIIFKRPLNNKKAYYQKLISNEAENEIALFTQHFSNDATFHENKYSYTILLNNYDKYLNDIAKYIDKRGMKSELRDDNHYIINYLKISAIRIYAELQAQYGQFSESPIIDISEIAEKYFNDTEFDTAFIEKIDSPKKLPAKKPSRPKSKPKNSFGFKNKDTKALSTVLNKLQHQIDLLQNKTSVEDLHKILTAKDFTDNTPQIYLQCETTQFSYVVSVLKPFFNGFNPTSIERSGKFFTKTGTQLKASNLYKNKVHNPKEKEEIDKIIQQLQ